MLGFRIHRQSTDADQAGTSFHDSTLINLRQENDRVQIEVELSSESPVRTVTVFVDGVRGVVRNGEKIDSLSPEKDDGEILRLHEEDGDVTFVVQWNDFAAEAHDIVVYKLLGGHIANLAS